MVGILCQRKICKGRFTGCSSEGGLNTPKELRPQKLLCRERERRLLKGGKHHQQGLAMYLRLISVSKGWNFRSAPPCLVPNSFNGGVCRSMKDSFHRYPRTWTALLQDVLCFSFYHILAPSQVCDIKIQRDHTQLLFCAVIRLVFQVYSTGQGEST